MLRYPLLLSALLFLPTLPAQIITATLLGTAGPSLSTVQAEPGLLVQAGSETLLFDCGHLFVPSLYRQTTIIARNSTALPRMT